MFEQECKGRDCSDASNNLCGLGLHVSRFPDPDLMEGTDRPKNEDRVVVDHVSRILHRRVLSSENSPKRRSATGGSELRWNRELGLETFRGHHRNHPGVRTYIKTVISRHCQQSDG